MRRLLIGIAAVVTLGASLLLAAPAQSVIESTPCGSVIPCGGPEDKVEQTVERIARLCQRYCQP